MTIKERLYKEALKRDVKDKYKIDKYSPYLYCIACGAYETLEDGILIQKHYRRCPTAQIERILAL